MDIVYEGKSYVLDLEDMDTHDTAVMEREAKIPTLVALEEGIQTGSVNALVFCFWLALKQSGEPVRYSNVSVKPIKFLRAIADAVKAGESTEDEAPKAEG